MKSKKKLLVLATLVIFMITGCQNLTDQNELVPFKKSFLTIPLDGPISKKKAEISGMAWMGDTLVLLPQYPEKIGEPNAILFTISKQSILDYLDGKFNEPISPGKINLTMPNLKEMIPDYEGFEAIEFRDQDVYLTIESGKDNHMMGYIISGKISSDSSEIRLDSSTMVKIPPPIQLDNRTDEALIIIQDRIFTFFEVNGASINSKPAAHVFDLNLNAEGTVSFPNLEYRVTDATSGAEGELWILNQASQKDAIILPQFDPLMPPQTRSFSHVERLVKLKFDKDGFTLAEFPPILINLGDSARNWEGLSLLDARGFLMVTDKSPDTILGFVSMP